VPGHEADREPHHAQASRPKSRAAAATRKGRSRTSRVTGIKHDERQARHGDDVLLDQAGWHTTRKLTLPANVTLLPLPAACPELNPAENVWQFLRANYLSILTRFMSAPVGAAYWLPVGRDNSRGKKVDIHKRF
jgi:hypothetical protein